MKLNETVLWVDTSGEVNLCAREGQDIRHWSILCPFRSGSDVQCGSWCPLFEIADFCTEPRGSTVVLHCGSGNRRFLSLPVVEEVKP